MSPGINEALIRVRSELNESVSVLWKCNECYKCDPKVLFTLTSKLYNNSAIVSTLYSSEATLKIDNKANMSLSCIIPPFENQGIYAIEILQNKTCTFTTITEATSIYYPLVGVILIQLFLDILRRFATTALVNRSESQNSTLNTEETETCFHLQHPIAKEWTFNGFAVALLLFLVFDFNTEDRILKVMPQIRDKQRVKSVDAFRGFCLFLMIFVNYGGGKLWLFEHSPWNGITIADLLFPWFIWIMGLSLAISMRAWRRKCTPLFNVFFKISTRSMKLFTLGVILNSVGNNNDIAKLRIPGVLQRFAVSYFVVAIVHMFFSKATSEAKWESWAMFQDIVLYWKEWLYMIILLCIHTLITFLVKVPDCPRGYLGPGGLQMGGKYFNCTGGAAGYIDRLLLGTNHIYSQPTTTEVYGTRQPYDPEGILGCLTSIFLTFLGLQAGKILIAFKSGRHRLCRWVLWGTFLGILAGVLCNFSKEDGWIPINKNLWSLTYVLCTASLAFILLSVFYIFIDMHNIWLGAPFIYPGMNSILIYVGHIMVTGMVPWFWAGPESYWRYLAMNFGGADLWLVIAYVLHKNRFYLKI